MHNRFKAIITIMVAIFVISSFSFIVTANTLDNSGTVTNSKGTYAWEYYDDDTLVITPDSYKTNLLIDKDDLPAGVLTSSTTVKIDVSNLFTYVSSQNGYMYIYGDNCPAQNLVFCGSTLNNFWNMNIYNFEKINSFRFETETTFYWIGFYNCQ